MSEFELEGGGVQLDFRRDWCARHLEPFREGWPTGAGLAMVLLFDAFTQDARVEAMAPELEDGSRDSRALPRLVAECSPLCCFLGDQIVDEIVAEALAGDGPRLQAIKARQTPNHEENR